MDQRGFVLRQTQWWDELEGCFHKHFLMLGQTHLEHLLDDKLQGAGAAVCRNTSVIDIKVSDEGCTTILSTGKTLHSRLAIGADGAHSWVRHHFNVPFEVTRPQISWAVLDGIIYTDFPRHRRLSFSRTRLLKWRGFRAKGIWTVFMCVWI